jgi:hypothetical protein
VTSIEAVVLGRNDEYEPDWNAKLFASLAYNRRLFERSAVDFRVAFVEWNPPAGRPLLAPALIERFPFVRVIVVDPRIHQQLCEDPNLQIMINFGCNAALRSSSADFSLITGGDEFFGSALARKILADGLRPGCLYRAERVNVREDLDFTNATPSELERSDNVVSIDASDGPPYTNACGDFLLLDRETMCGLRGLDETVRGARLHLDSRFVLNAMLAEADCEMLGRIYHVNHRKSYRNMADSYPGRGYRWDLGLPYLNAPDWGLEGFDWRVAGERLSRVGLRDAATTASPERRSAGGRAAAVFDRLEAVRRATQPESPQGFPDAGSVEIELKRLATYEPWGSTLGARTGVLVLETAAQQWAYAAALPLDDVPRSADRWYWILLELAVREGSIGIGFLTQTADLIGERFVTSGEAQKIAIPVPAGAKTLLLRNVEPGNARSVVALLGAKLVDASKGR